MVRLPRIPGFDYLSTWLPRATDGSDTSTESESEQRDVEMSTMPWDEPVIPRHEQFRALQSGLTVQESVDAGDTWYVRHEHESVLQFYMRALADAASRHAASRGSSDAGSHTDTQQATHDEQESPGKLSSLRTTTSRDFTSGHCMSNSDGLSLRKIWIWIRMRLRDIWNDVSSKDYRADIKALIARLRDKFREWRSGLFGPLPVQADGYIGGAADGISTRDFALNHSRDLEVGSEVASEQSRQASSTHGVVTPRRFRRTASEKLKWGD